MFDNNCLNYYEGLVIGKCITHKHESYFSVFLAIPVRTAIEKQYIYLHGNSLDL